MSYRYRRSGDTSPVVKAGLVIVVLAALAHSHPKIPGHRPAAAPRPSGASSAAAARAVAYARGEVGQVPYLWGGTTTAGMDCSGLVQWAYAQAGVSIQRTSQEQWASEPHVTSPRPGDLVFFPGIDGTPASPGHVGIVTDPAKHLMIDAYGAGTMVRYDIYGPDATAPGLSDVTGYTRPGA